VTAPRSIAFAMLLLATAPAAMAAALEQDGPPAEPSTATGQAPALRAGPRGRPFMAALFAVPLVTFAGPVGPRGSELVSPAERFAITQLVGGGYVVNQRFRFGAIAVFNEALTGLPPGNDAWQFGGVAPIAIATFGHFIIGSGPLIGYRSAGRRQTDAGVVVLSGASIPVRKGISVNIVAPVTALFMHRRTVSIGVAAGVAKVFGYLPLRRSER
jgi:hypothetical protein